MNTTTTPFDRAGEFIADFRKKHFNPNGRTFCKITTMWFGNLEYVHAKAGRMEEIHLYRDGAEEFGYWLVADERRPLIAKMLKSGMKSVEAARLLGVHSSTVYADVRYMRLFTTLLADIEGRFKPLKRRGPTEFLGESPVTQTAIKAQINAKYKTTDLH